MSDKPGLWQCPRCGFALAKLERMTALLREADKVIVWESQAPSLGRDFQERVEAALGIGDVE